MNFFDKLFIERRTIEPKKTIPPSSQPVDVLSPPSSGKNQDPKPAEAQPVPDPAPGPESVETFDPLLAEDDYANLFERIWEASLAEKWAEEGVVRW